MSSISFVKAACEEMLESFQAAYESQQLWRILQRLRAQSYTYTETAAIVLAVLDNYDPETDMMRAFRPLYTSKPQRDLVQNTFYELNAVLNTIQKH